MLLAAAAAGFAHAQPQQPSTEAQARYYVYGAFLTHAVPEIMGERVTLGPELVQRLGVAPNADPASIYEALMNYTDKRALNVRKATNDEIARYKTQNRRELKDPLFTVQAGDITLLVEYDLAQNTIPFVGQIGVAYQPPVATPRPVPTPAPTPPIATPRPAPTPAPTPPAAEQPRPAPKPPVATVAPRPAPVVPVAPAPKPPVATVAPRPAPVVPVAPAPVARPQEVLKPNGPCIVQPVMSEQDLANCRPAPGPAARIDPGSPAAPRPATAAAPKPAPKPATPCEIKPVMSEEDLIACGIRR